MKFQNVDIFGPPLEMKMHDKSQIEPTGLINRMDPRSVSNFEIVALSNYKFIVICDKHTLERDRHHSVNRLTCFPPILKN